MKAQKKCGKNPLGLFPRLGMFTVFRFWKGKFGFRSCQFCHPHSFCWEKGLTGHKRGKTSRAQFDNPLGFSPLKNVLPSTFVGGKRKIEKIVPWENPSGAQEKQICRLVPQGGHRENPFGRRGLCQLPRGKFKISGVKPRISFHQPAPEIPGLF